MSKCQSFASSVVRSIFFVLLVLFSAPSYGDFEDFDNQCSAAIPVKLDSTVRGTSGYSGETHYIRLEIPSPGILQVTVSAPAAAPAEPKLGFVGAGCGVLKAPSEPVFLQRSTSHLVLAVRDPGSYVFRVASEDSLTPLGEVKLSNAFLSERPAAGTGGPPGACSGQKHGLVRVVGTKEDEEEIEVEADPLAYCDPLVHLPTKEDEEEIEVEADPQTHSISERGRTLHSRLAALCQRGPIDDHGDSFTCATFLNAGRAVSGQIGNGWGDDSDVFTFVLGARRETDLWTVEIEAGGEIETFGILYDQHGHRLAKADGGESGGGFRIVDTLRPGTYFVRVEGGYGAKGTYSLKVGASPW